MQRVGNDSSAISGMEDSAFVGRGATGCVAGKCRRLLADVRLLVVGRIDERKRQ